MIKVVFTKIKKLLMTSALEPVALSPNEHVETIVETRIDDLGRTIKVHRIFIY